MTLAQLIETEIGQQTADLSGTMLEVCRYATEGGRRTRGMLLLAASQQSGPRAVRAATAIEMIHAATLLQDDIFDAGKLRRGRLVAHLRFGKPLAILASDWLLIRALELAAGIDTQFFCCLARAGTSMVQAEARELSPVALDSFKQAQSYGTTIAEGKTAALFGTALCGAAVLRGLRTEERSRWEEIGVQMGLTYQWVDDCVDLYGVETAAGKTVGHDLVAGCLTIPVLLAARSLEQQGTPICLQDLQSGHLPPSELKRLDTAVHSSHVIMQMHDLLQNRLQAHRKDALEAGLCGVTVHQWILDLLGRLEPCFPTLPSRTLPSRTTRPQPLLRPRENNMRKDTFVAAAYEAGLLLLAALLSYFLKAPLVFTSLGPTIYEIIETPAQPSARPYNVLVGHAVGILAGVMALGITHAFAAPAVSVHGIPLVRVFSVVIAGFLTVVGTLMLKATQPAALSTTLLIALGTMQTWHAILSIACGVSLIAAAGEFIRRSRINRS